MDTDSVELDASHSSPLRVLQICPKPPYPPVDGGCIAANNITNGLLGLGHRVKVVSIATPKHPATDALANTSYCDETRFEACNHDTRVKAWSALRHLFSKRSYNIERFYTKRFETLLRKTLESEEFDVIHFESAYVAPYLDFVRSVSNAPAVYRAHNLEFEIWRGTQALEPNPLKRAYVGHLANQLERYERTFVNDFDGVAAITDADKRTFERMGCRKPITTIPFGLDVKSVSSDCKPAGTTIFHLGSMDWLPNQDGMKWFLRDVWPHIVSEHPDVSLVLAGRSMPTWLSTLNMKSVQVVGEVPSAFDFMASHSIMIVPLHSGGGMRIKIIEGMALEKPIVSTSLGAAGVDYVDGEHLLIADTSDLFAERVSELIADSELRKRIASAGRRLAESHYDNSEISAKLVGFYRQLAGHSG
ncbi:MAG: glycosyltransferase family 4 protein [Woeseiaceae bacterium]|nr:glycosyltransferase family 4 protein [Woeseiaceae bacterium]